MGDVIPLEIKYISVVACCDDCAATWIAHLRESDYKKYLKGKKSICPHCQSDTVFYCSRLKH